MNRWIEIAKEGEKKVFIEEWCLWSSFYCRDLQEYILPVPDITIVKTEGEATYEVDLMIIHRILVKKNVVLGKCATKTAFNFNCWKRDDDSLEDKVTKKYNKQIYYIAYG